MKNYASNFSLLINYELNQILSYNFYILNLNFNILYYKLKKFIFTFIFQIINQILNIIRLCLGFRISSWINLQYIHYFFYLLIY